MKTHSLKVFVEETNINFYGWQLILEGFFFSSRLKKYVDQIHKAQFVYIRNDLGQSGIDVESWQKLGERVMQGLQSRRISLQGLKSEHHRLGENIFKVYQEIRRWEMSKVKNSQFIAWFKRLWKDYLEINAIGLIPVASDYEHSFLTKKLTEILSARKLSPAFLQEAMNILMSPTLPTAAWHEQLDLLNLAFRYDNIRKIKASKEFQDHLKKWEWLNYGYQGPQVKEQDFLARAKKLLEKKKSLKKELIEHKHYFKKLLAQQKKLVSQLKLSSQEKYLFKAAGLFTYLKGYRVDVRHYFHFISDLMFSELRRRFRLPFSLFRYAETSEILKVLQGKKVDKEKILARRKRLLWVVDLTLGRSYYVPPNKISAFLEKYIKEEKVRQTDIIQGQPAFLGKVRGEVKIVYSIKDIEKVQHGDVLVAITTNPDLLPAMYRAVAFVTDSGGITSHAAIVARELKKPCVIGTKFATKVFKDGDIVEVDANKGVVRKI